MADRSPSRALLDWYLEAGVDECIGEAPVDRFADREPARGLAEAPAAAAPSSMMPSSGMTRTFIEISSSA